MVNHWHQLQAGHQELGLAPASKLQGSKMDLALVSKEVNLSSPGPRVVSTQALDFGHFSGPCVEVLLWKLLVWESAIQALERVKNYDKEARN